MNLKNRQAMADQGKKDRKNGAPAFCWFGPAGTLWMRTASGERLVDAANTTELLEAAAYALAYEQEIAE